MLDNNFKSGECAGEVSELQLGAIVQSATVTFTIF